ncbi:MAG TPA: CDP-alcohol phosphatidyltransferase family protein [Mycobacteriales bacterium]|nr:CDP-alcohol phosphatidyltransferase family protein [Mycobacteriales bacterium]
MLNLRVRPSLTRLTDPLAVRLLAAGISPDAVTIVGTLGASVGALALFPRGEFLAGTVVVTLCVLTDLLDGAMARRRGTASRFGAWLDSSCDRVADAAIFSGLVLWYAGDGANTLFTALALYCLVSGGLVSYVKARAEGLGLRCDVGLAERAERLIVMLVGTGLAGLGLPVALKVALWILAAASTVTVVQRLVEVRRQADAAV